jgi:hypothetical protein
MILHKLTKKEFYILAKLVLAELDEGQNYFDNGMTRAIYDSVKGKYNLNDLEIEYMRLFRSWPFVLRCKDGSVLKVTTPLIKNKYRYTYNENGDCVGFVDSVNEKRNRNKEANIEKQPKPQPKSSLSVEEQIKVIKSFNRKHQEKFSKLKTIKIEED